MTQPGQNKPQFAYVTPRESRLAGELGIDTDPRRDYVVAHPSRRNEAQVVADRESLPLELNDVCPRAFVYTLRGPKITEETL